MSEPNLAVTSDQSGTVTSAIAEFTVSTPPDSIPESARHVMRLSLLDWVAVGLAGREEPVSRIVREMVASEGGAPQAGVFGLEAKLPARAAALANGTISHALDYDDTHFLHVGHPSVAVLPAALAIAEKVGASEADFLDAALIGAECSCRIGAWLGRQHYQTGFHQTATAGCFGAAMAAARLLGVNAERASYALGLATTRASGLKSQFGTMGKPYNAGMAAASGVEVALLAASGFESRADGLECAQGFGETHAGENVPADDVLSGIGVSYVFEEVQHKFHACCHGLHAALEALLELKSRHALKADDITSIKLNVNPRWLKVCNIAEPETGLEAKFSYRLTAAMALCGYDTSALSTYTSENCDDPDLNRLRDRVFVVADEAVSDTAARVEVRTTGSEVFQGFHDLALPLPLDVREQKVRSKAAVLLGNELAEFVWGRVAVLSGSTAPIQSHSLFSKT